MPIGRAGKPTILRLEVNDLQSTIPIVSRVRIRNSSGNDLIPSGLTSVPISNCDTWFVCPKNTEIEVPAGDYEIRVEKGLEYRPYKQTVTVQDGILNTIVINLDRWIDMDSLGYLSGDMHSHLSIEGENIIAAKCAAEGLDFGSYQQNHNYETFPPASSSGHIKNFPYYLLILLLSFKLNEYF